MEISGVRAVAEVLPKRVRIIRRTWQVQYKLALECSSCGGWSPSEVPSFCPTAFAICDICQ